MQLEEFRKKKAEERAKKTASSGTVQNSKASQNQKQPVQVENVRVNELDGVTTSDGIGGAVTDTGTSSQNVNLFNQSSNQGSLAGASSLVRNDLNTSTTSPVEEHSDIDEGKRYNASTFITSEDVGQNSDANKTNDIYGIHTGGVGGFPYGTTNHQSTFLRSQGSQEFDNSTSQSSLHGMNGSQPNKSNNSVKDYAVTDGSSPYFPSKIIRENSVDSLQKAKPTNSSTLDSGSSHGSVSGGNNLTFIFVLLQFHISIQPDNDLVLSADEICTIYDVLQASVILSVLCLERPLDLIVICLVFMVQLYLNMIPLVMK